MSTFTMNRMRQVIFLIVILTFFPAFSSRAETRPNIVIIYGDDVGYGDVGAYGAKLIPTPNIDRLAAEGLRFTDGHASSATCTPSRYSLLTGILPFRNKVRILNPGGELIIPVDQPTLPRMLQSAGYTTAVIGKWHLGLGDGNLDWNGEIKPGPLEVGFDSAFLLPNTNDRVPTVYVDGHHVVNLDPADPIYISRNKAQVSGKENTEYPDAVESPEKLKYFPGDKLHSNSITNGISRIGFMSGGKSALWDDYTMADVFVEKATTFIEQHKDKPFFLFFSSQDIHAPRTPNPRFAGKSQAGVRGDAMVQFDWSVGEVMKALEKAGIADNTIVIFSSDNGPVYFDGYEDDPKASRTKPSKALQAHSASGPWTGGKYSLNEGGTRVPLIIRWPAKIEPGASNALVTQTDLYASIAALLDIPLTAKEAPDSRDMLAAFTKADAGGAPFVVQEANLKLGLREGKWKYTQNKEALFDLETDPAETRNVAAKHPEVLQRMRKLMHEIADEGISLRALE